MCIRVCCVCKVNLGSNGYSCNQITHGYCPVHLAEALAEVDKLEKEIKKNAKPKRRR